MRAPGPLRILVDAMVLKPGVGGIATYTRGVVEALAGRADVVPYVLTSQPEHFAEMSGVEIVRAPELVRSYPRRVMWREARLREVARGVRADLVFSSTIESPLRPIGLPVVIVVHDMGPAQSPALYGWGRWARYHSLLRRSLEVADLVICVSGTTQIQLKSSIRHDDRKVRVIGESGGSMVVPSQSEPLARAGGRVLYVGTLMPHKNVPTLIAAIADPLLSAATLTAVGPVTVEERLAFSRAADDSGVGARVKHEGYVNRDRLDELYRTATCLALPTLNEGFGLPLLESQMRSVPVVASSIPAFREVASTDSAAWVENPLDPHEWAVQIARVDSDLALRARMVTAGIESASVRTWDGVTNELVREFFELVDGKV